MPYKGNHFIIRFKEEDARLVLAALELRFHGEPLEMQKKIARLTLRLRRFLKRFEFDGPGAVGDTV